MAKKKEEIVEEIINENISTEPLEDVMSDRYASDMALIPGSGRSPRKGNGNSLQYSCLENSMDRGASQAIVHGKEQDTTDRLHFHFHLKQKLVDHKMKIYKLFFKENQ